MQCPLVRASMLAALYSTLVLESIVTAAKGEDPNVNSIVACTGKDCGFWNTTLKVCGQSQPTISPKQLYSIINEAVVEAVQKTDEDRVESERSFD